jgi:hypothetical protein
MWEARPSAEPCLLGVFAQVLDAGFGELEREVIGLDVQHDAS